MRYQNSQPHYLHPVFELLSLHSTGFGTVGTKGVDSDGNPLAELRLNGETYSEYFGHEGYRVSVRYITIADLLNGAEFSDEKEFVPIEILMTYTEIREKKYIEKISEDEKEDPDKDSDDDSENPEDKTVSENGI